MLVLLPILATMETTEDGINERFVVYWKRCNASTEFKPEIAWLKVETIPLDHGGRQKNVKDEKRITLTNLAIHFIFIQKMIDSHKGYLKLNWN